MDNWGDLIGPIVVLVIYAFTKIFGGKAAEDMFEEREDKAVDERETHRRRVQEEIRRRIAERRREQQEGTEQPEQQRQGGYDPFAPESSKPTTPTPVRESVQQRQQPASARRAQTTYNRPATQASQGQRMQDALAEQVARLKKAREEKERALRESRKKLGSAAYDIKGEPVSASMTEFSGNMRNDLLMQLRSKEGVRQAFVLQEILGKPLATRGNESTVPGLQQ